MTRHPDKKQLINILLGSAKDKSSAAAISHLKECKECANTMESLKIIIHASDNSFIAPPEHIKDNLFLSHDNSYKASYGKTEVVKSAVKLLLRPALIAAAAVIVVAITVITFYTNKEQIPANVALKLSVHHGSIAYNNIVLDKNTAEINSGHNIRTGDNSAAFLELESAFSASIAENTNISLIEAKKISEKDSKKYSISLSMGKGTIMISSNHNIIKKYTITTPQGIFEPIGTGFILSSDISSTKLLVLEGMVRVSTPENSEIILKKGEGCEINSGIKKINIDLEIAINSFNKVFFNAEDRKTPASEKIQEKNSLNTDNTENGKNEEIDKTRQEIQKPEESENDLKELRKDKIELRNEEKDIQKEMRKNRNSGKGK